VIGQPQIFVDDSGSEPQSPIFFLGGLISSAEQWAVFSDDWALALAEPPALEYFKMSEAASLQGQFAKWRGWDETKRDDRLLTLARIIRRHVRLRVSVSIRHDLFQKYMMSVPAVERNLATDSPYVLLFTQMVTVAVLFAHKHGVRDACDFIFDEQGASGEEALRHWSLYKVALNGSIRRELFSLIGSPPIFRDEKEFLPLQAADLYAWQARNHYVENHQVENQTIKIPMNKILDSLRGIPRFHRPITEGELIQQHASMLRTGERFSKERPGVPLIPAADTVKERKAVRKRARKARVT